MFLPKMINRIGAVLLLLTLVATTALCANVKAVGTIGLTVDSIARELPFYTDVLSFEKVGDTEEQGPAADALTALPGVHTRTVTLRLGAEKISLTEYVSPKGRPIPADSRSIDHWFQHIAIVVRDMDSAYASLVRRHVKHVSTAPQTLPEWNKGAAGIKAFYFSDPEDHVLEIIWFPAGKGDPKWQQQTDKLFLGIDHTAIVVSDTERSLAYYRDQLGLRVAGESENYGVEQEHLNQTFGARLRITGLRAPAGPGIEFLEYVAPPGGRALPADARANDLVAWKTELRVADAIATARAGATSDGHTLSEETKDGRVSRILVRDPDGHILQLTR